MTAKSTNGAEKQRRFRHAALLVSLFQIPVVAWLGLVLPRNPAAFLVLAAFLLWFNAGIVIHVGHVLPARPLSRFSKLFFVYPAVILWFACLLLVPLFLVFDLMRIGGWVGHPDLEAGFLVAGILVSAYATLIRIRWVRLRRYTVRVPGLPPDLEAYRIAHLSDLHIGNFFGTRDLEKWARTVDRVRPDLVVLTGDLVDAGAHGLETLCKELDRFRAPDGVYACPGNHDALTTRSDYWDCIAAGGVVPLRNRGVYLSRRASPIYLAGVDDVWQGLEDTAQALSEWNGTSVCILLAHDPILEQAAVSRRVTLALFGHTHGGQVAVPGFPAWNLSMRAYPHGGGLRQVGRTWIHISRGLGTAGIPVRVGAAPEITVLELRGA